MNFQIRQVDWDTDRHELLAVRYKVFVEGQNVPVEIEVDDKDTECIHFLAHDDQGQTIGTARVDRTGHIGRVAVLKEWRHKGVGSALMVASVARLKQDGRTAARLNSQTSAAPFYEKLGFIPHGDEFLEAGIPHVAMSKRIDE